MRTPAHRLLGIGGGLGDLVGRGVDRQRQGHLHQVEAHVVGTRRGEGAAVDDVKDMPTRRLRRGSEYWRSCSFSTAASRVGSSEPGRTQPRSPPVCGGRALGELLGDRPEGRAALELLDDAVGADRLASSAWSARSIGTKISATRNSVLPTFVRACGSAHRRSRLPRRRPAAARGGGGSWSRRSAPRSAALRCRT